MRRLVSVALLVIAVGFPAGVAFAAEPPVFLYVGERDPTGADESFLALGRRRGATTLRETPGRLTEEGLGARLARAIKEYEQLRFVEAIAALDDLEREAVASGGGGLTQGELLDLYAHRAAARITLGQEAAAWDDLVQLNVLAPNRPLDAARFAPGTIEAARRAAQAPRAAAQLRVAAEPADCILIVDGAVLGRGSVELRLPVGRHFVRAERAGLRGTGRLVGLGESGGTTRFELAPLVAPSIEDLARRGALAGARQVLAASLLANGPRARLALQWVDVPGHRSLGRQEVALDEQLTTAALAAAIDALLGAAPQPALAPARTHPWYRKPLVWGVTASVLAAGALGVGLGVGLSNRPQGAVTHVDLGAAR